jgi:hypothetical protein
MTIQVWTRNLEPEEMVEFLSYVDGLNPPYTLHDGDRKTKERLGGRLLFRANEVHDKEVLYIKLKWG